MSKNMVLVSQIECVGGPLDGEIANISIHDFEFYHGDHWYISSCFQSASGAHVFDYRGRIHGWSLLRS